MNPQQEKQEIDQFAMVRKLKRNRDKNVSKSDLVGWPHIFDPELSIDKVGACSAVVNRVQAWTSIQINMYANTEEATKKWSQIGDERQVSSKNFTVTQIKATLRAELKKELSAYLADLLEKRQDIISIRIDETGVWVRRDNRRKKDDVFGPGHPDFKPWGRWHRKDRVIRTSLKRN